jgi:hypothetical protein
MRRKVQYNIYGTVEFNEKTRKIYAEERKRGLNVEELEKVVFHLKEAKDILEKGGFGFGSLFYCKVFDAWCEATILVRRLKIIIEALEKMEAVKNE